MFKRFKTIFSGFTPVKKIDKIICFECGRTDCEYFKEVENYDPEEGENCCRHSDSIPPGDFCSTCSQDYYDSLC
ncbi:MAG: hypothetical protein KJI71_01470 [Patescibacteria group bacterium]|nr:hypothetical protein [Patescibacteria group bacterium]